MNTVIKLDRRKAIIKRGFTKSLIEALAVARNSIGGTAKRNTY